MAQLAKHKTVAAPFSNEKEVVRVVYDFAEDGGATGSLNVFTASGGLIIKSIHAVVKTTCTSAGAATLDLGVAGGDVDALLNAIPVASLVANGVFTDELVEGTPNTKTVPMYLADAASVAMAIGTAAFTAGKIEFVFEIMKP